MLLSVYMPHSGGYEDDLIEALSVVRNIMTEGRMAGAVDFYIGGDINIQMKLGNTGDERYGMYGPECRGGSEVVITHEKLRWLQLLKEFNCTVTSTWTNNDDGGECHTWRAWRSRVREKQLY